jgi:hypothetical protein
MLIRPALIVVALATCTTSAEPVASEAEQVGQAVCDVRKYACDPLDPAAQTACDVACRFEGSYCLDHSDAEYAYCWRHPDSFLRGYRYCDPWGLPDWTTFCVAGPIAAPAG